MTAEPSHGDPTPAVAVIIPAYNAAAHIGEALESVFAQAFTGYEVIVVNDGSPDTPDLERALEPYRGRIVYLAQKNQGPSAARNAAILKARAEYVAFLDSDDLWAPNHLAEQMKAFSADPTLDLVVSDALLFGEGVPPGLTFMQAARSHAPITFEGLLRFECSILTSAVVARRQSLIEAGLFDPRFFHSEDYDLWLRLLHAGGRPAYQPQVLGFHRTHHKSLSADAIRMCESKIAVYQKLANTLSLPSHVRHTIQDQIRKCGAELSFERGRQQFIAGQYEQSVLALEQANEYYRSLKLRLIVAGLRAAPRLLRHVYNIRHGLLTGNSFRLS